MRRRRAEKRKIAVDPRYGNHLVSLLINMVMRDGKKELARRIVYSAFEKVSEILGKGDPIGILLVVLENTRTRFGVVTRRVGGASLQIPMERSYEKQVSDALRDLAKAADARKGVRMEDGLASEIVDAYNNTGTVVAKKEREHKNAAANKMYAHLKW